MDEKTFTVAFPVNSQNVGVYAGASRKRDVTPVDSIVNGNISVAASWLQSEWHEWGWQMWSLSNLAQRLTVHTNTIVKSSKERARCLISKQNVAVTSGRFSRMALLCTWPITHWSALRKRRLISLNLTCGPNLNPIDYTVWSALQQQVYRGWKFNTVEELK